MRAYVSNFNVVFKKNRLVLPLGSNIPFPFHLRNPGSPTNVILMYKKVIKLVMWFNEWAESSFEDILQNNAMFETLALTRVINWCHFINISWFVNQWMFFHEFSISMLRMLMVGTIYQSIQWIPFSNVVTKDG